MMSSLVSVIIPTYKRSDTLPRAIDSVLNQTYPNIEILVVDDNGEGTEFQLATGKCLRSYIDSEKLIYIKHPVNKNGSAARNTGWRASHGEYLCFFDDDDEMFPNYIELQVKKLSDSSKEVGACYCRPLIKRINSAGRKIERKNMSCEEGRPILEYLTGSPRASFGTSSILFRRCVIEELEGWDESYYRHQDLELMTRFFRNYKIVLSSEEVLYISDLNDRSNMSNPQKDYDIKKKYLSEFEPDFMRWGINDDVMHHFWMSCAATALYSSDYVIFKKAYSQGGKYKLYTIKEKIHLLKYFISGRIHAYRGQ